MSKTNLTPRQWPEENLLSDFILKSVGFIIKLYYKSTALLYPLTQIGGPGRHESIGRVVWEGILKWDDSAAAFNQPASEINACHITELVIRDIQQFRKLHAIRTRLIQHDQKFAVCQHCSGGMRLEEIIHVLCQPCAARAVLPHTLPKRKKKVRAVLMLDKEDISRQCKAKCLYPSCGCE